MLNVLLLLCNSLFLSLRLSGGGGGSFPKPLTREEEADCLNRAANGDLDARNQLIEHNLRLVAHIVKKYGARGENEQEDLLSIGTVGLIKAVTTFDPARGIRLTTYAARCIENEILMEFRSRKKTAGEIYMDDPIDTDAEGNALTLSDVIADGGSIGDEIERKLRVERLYGLLNGILTERERQIIALRYGLTERGELTQHVIARELGISRSYVSRIEKSALRKLRDAF